MKEALSVRDVWERMGLYKGTRLECGGISLTLTLSLKLALKDLFRFFFILLIV